MGAEETGVRDMSELSVRTVAENPEPAAWSMLQAWAEPQGMFDDVSSHPVYGFNNPGPSPDRSDYGYEFWIKVSDGVESSGDVQVRDFEGGLYAVTTCALAGRCGYSCCTGSRKANMSGAVQPTSLRSWSIREPRRKTSSWNSTSQ
jgi:hypothetical protein